MGGGLLETNNQLERFTKNKKSKKLTYSIIGILVIIGSITLFKTYAFFEEKKEFNVLKGTIPEFSQEDIQISFTIDGEKGNQFPDKTSRYVGKTVTCEKKVEASWNNETWGLEIINSHQQKRINCSVEFKTISEFSEAKLGDYVSYTPSKTNYEITSDLTGYNTVQTINPSELNLWRIIRKNSDGSIEMVSEYISNEAISFYGKEGYKNLVASLNTIAKQYETEGITIDSRSFGYRNQTQNLTELSCISGNSNCLESQGGGDAVHSVEHDVELVLKALGRITAKNPSQDELRPYFLASRYYDTINYLIRYVASNGVIYLLSMAGAIHGESTISLAFRPIVILKSNIDATGKGLKENSWKIN